MKKKLFILFFVGLLLMGCRSVDMTPVYDEHIDWTEDMEENPENYTVFIDEFNTKIIESQAFLVDWGVGNIHITGVPGTEMHAEFEIIIRGGTKLERKKLLRELNLHYGATLVDGSRTMEVEHMPTHSSPWSQWMSMPEGMELCINATLNLPDHMDGVDINNGVGIVTIEDFYGSVDIDNGVGDVVIKKVQGNMDIDVGVGDLYCEETDFIGHSKIDLGTSNARFEKFTWKNVKSLVIEQGVGDISFDVLDEERFVAMLALQDPIHIEQGMGMIYVNGVEQ